MDMTEQERQLFAERLRREQAVRFGGIAKAAYTAAKVNAATWTRATNGETIRPHKTHQIVANLWPDTLGDWTQIPTPGIRQPVGGVETPGLLAELLERFNTFDERLAAVEREVSRGRPNLTAVAKTGKIEESGEFE